MKQILYVDDNKTALESMAEVLQGRVIDWNFTCSSSSAEAYSLLADNAYDVIVASAKLGGSSGEDLLKTASVQHPSALRLIVDQIVHPESIFVQARIAHQYLSEPCQPEELVATIMGLSEFQEELQSKSLQALVGSLDRIPSLPTLYAEIMAELRSPSSTLEKVGGIISGDMAMTTKVLQLANSAFFGFSHRIVDPGHAVAVLGINTISSLVLSAGIFAQASEAHSGGVNMGDLVEHSTLVASLARDLSESRGLEPERTDMAFLAGFLHDIGKVILAANLPGKYQEVLDAVREEGILLPEAEQNILGADHAHVGGYLLSLWGLPNHVAEAVMRHHNPAQSRDIEFTPLTAVHAGNAFAEIGDSLEADPDIDSQYLQRIGMLDFVPMWRLAYIKAHTAGKTAQEAEV